MRKNKILIWLLGILAIISVIGISTLSTSTNKGLLSKMNDDKYKELVEPIESEDIKRKYFDMLSELDEEISKTKYKVNITPETELKDKYCDEIIEKQLILIKKIQNQIKKDPITEYSVKFMLEREEEWEKEVIKEAKLYKKNSKEPGLHASIDMKKNYLIEKLREHANKLISENII